MIITTTTTTKTTTTRTTTTVCKMCAWASAPEWVARVAN